MQYDKYTFGKGKTYLKDHIDRFYNLITETLHYYYEIHLKKYKKNESKKERIFLISQSFERLIYNINKFAYSSEYPDKFLDLSIEGSKKGRRKFLSKESISFKKMDFIFSKKYKIMIILIIMVFLIMKI